MQHLQIAVLKGHRAACRARETFSEGLLEVVAHFSFEHHVREHLVAHASSQSRHVGARLRQSEIIPVCAHLIVILRFS